MSVSHTTSWYWPPAFNDARQLVEYYEQVAIPDEALFRFANAYTRRAVAEGATGTDTRIPPHVMQTVLRASMMRGLAKYFPLTEQQKVDKHELNYIGGDQRTVKWIALHFKTDELGFDALYGEV